MSDAQKQHKITNTEFQKLLLEYNHILYASKTKSIQTLVQIAADTELANAVFDLKTRYTVIEENKSNIQKKIAQMLDSEKGLFKSVIMKPLKVAEEKSFFPQPEV